ncbi:MAG: D-tyrosyl-tRNA(Tyr) deacylase [Clostridia bacterium]|nr:D-tyrosyl-tRNA(Tyr) deacylase [Clostridia bacterium]
MKAIIQRVSRSQVVADGVLTGKIGHGLMILLGVGKGDDYADADLLAEKISKLRIFSDENGKMNKSVIDVGGEALVVSNFTLYANYAHGNRPDYFDSEAPERANELYTYFADKLKALIGGVATGIFGADMQIDMCCDGPVTIVMESDVLKNKGKR